jgi:hypothetical protein
MLPRRFRSSIIDAAELENDEVLMKCGGVLATQFDHVHTKVEMRTPDYSCVFLACDRVTATSFDGATLKFSCSLSSLCDFGTTPPVRRVHFFLDFIFH